MTRNFGSLPDKETHAVRAIVRAEFLDRLAEARIATNLALSRKDISPAEYPEIFRAALSYYAGAASYVVEDAQRRVESDASRLVALGSDIPPAVDDATGAKPLADEKGAR